MTLKDAFAKSDRVRRASWPQAHWWVTAEYQIALKAALADDWEPYQAPCECPWVKEAKDVWLSNQHKGMEGLVTDIAKALKQKFEIDVERLAEDVADPAHRWSDSIPKHLLKEFLVRNIERQRTKQREGR